MPGFTTNGEWGQYVRTFGKIILAYPIGAPKMGYLDRVTRRFGNPVLNDLEEAIDLAISQVG